MATQETQVGVAKFFGLIGATMVSLTGSCTLTLESADIEDKFDLQKSKGQDGNTETMYASDQTLEVSINFAPNGDSRTAAGVSLVNCRPAPLEKVTLSGFAAAIYNGPFNYVGGWNVKMVRDKEIVCGIKLSAHLANRASLTAGVIIS